MQTVDKIRKLLELGNNNSNPHESALALEKAQQLALEHGINLSQLPANPTSEGIDHTTLHAGKRLVVAHKYVAKILVSFFNVALLTSGGRLTGRKIYLVGKKTDVQTAVFVYNFLAEAMGNCWRNYYAENPSIGLTHKDSYFMGFYVGLRTQLDANREKIESDNKDKMAGYQLMRITDDTKIKNHITNMFGVVRHAPTKKTTSVYGETYRAGIEEGENFTIATGYVE
jgi:hypothetical protein